MSASSSTAADAWRGCTETGVMAGDATAPDDYDRACAVEDLAGVTTVGEGGAQALVLADKPATSCYLPERRGFLRWLAADSEVGPKAAAEAVLADPATEWEECAKWVSDGPADAQCCPSCDGHPRPSVGNRQSAIGNR
ncbi:Imm21 family immunity protein [Streptomyces adustus]